MHQLLCSLLGLLLVGHALTASISKSADQTVEEAALASPQDGMSNFPGEGMGAQPGSFNQAPGLPPYFAGTVNQNMGPYNPDLYGTEPSLYPGGLPGGLTGGFPGGLTGGLVGTGPFVGPIDPFTGRPTTTTTNTNNPNAREETNVNYRFPQDGGYSEGSQGVYPYAGVMGGPRGGFMGPNAGFPNPGFPNTGFPSTGFPNTGFPNTGFPNSGFPNAGFPNTGFPNTGFPNTGFPNTGFPNAGFRNTAFPNTGFPNTGTPFGTPQGNYGRFRGNFRGQPGMRNQGVNQPNRGNPSTAVGNPGGSMVSEGSFLAPQGGFVSGFPGPLPGGLRPQMGLDGVSQLESVKEAAGGAMASEK